MNKTFLLFSGLAVCILMLSNFSENTKSYVFMALSDSPDLPDTPFPYSDVVIPDHLVNSSPEPDSTDLGYAAVGVDPGAFNIIEDDIATLGRVLFYDEKLSALENISCGSCHKQELSFAENKSFSEGISSPTRRNSMHLNDLAWTNREGFFWDLSQFDLKEMISLPLMDENEIGATMGDIEIKLAATDYYPDLFTNAFGDATINEDRITESLMQFISSINTFNSDFDIAAESDFQDFTEAESHGLRIFGNSCASCHSQGGNPFIPLIDLEFFPPGEILQIMPFIFNNGLPIDPDDRGAGEWLEGMDDLFKPPTLRNIELTAPYMHDGRFTNLDEVIDHYSEDVEENEWSVGFIPPGGFGFSNEEKDHLKAFLLTLTDHTFATEEKWSDPFAATSGTEELLLTDIVVRPNPMSERSHIEFSNPNSELVSMSIYDTQGKLMTHKNTTGSNFRVEKLDYGQGMYYINIVMGDKKATHKLLVR